MFLIYKNIKTDSILPSILMDLIFLIIVMIFYFEWDRILSIYVNIGNNLVDKNLDNLSLSFINKK